MDQVSMLEACAVSMGYKPFISDKKEVFIPNNYSKFGRLMPVFQRYDPHSDPNQLVELIDKFQISIQYLKNNRVQASLNQKSKEFSSLEKNLSQAVCSVVYQYSASK